jgi:hypothetical protein
MKATYEEELFVEYRTEHPDSCRNKNRQWHVIFTPSYIFMSWHFSTGTIQRVGGVIQEELVKLYGYIN